MHTYEKILIVEDSPLDQLVIQRTLARAAVARTIDVASGGWEALVLLGLEPDATGKPQRSELPELVLLDLVMPDINGLEVLARMRQAPATRQIPVAVFTTLEDQEVRQQCEALGVRTFFHKPLDCWDFIQSVTRITESGPALVAADSPPALS